ncbi:hypothetical protein BH10ACI1_BH10ACI1_10150 [soil metagenome]
MLKEAKGFAEIESGFAESSLFGVADGKAVGTCIEDKYESVIERQTNKKIGKIFLQ